jgi:hypothetical protein
VRAIKHETDFSSNVLQAGFQPEITSLYKPNKPKFVISSGDEDHWLVKKQGFIFWKAENSFNSPSFA